MRGGLGECRGDLDAMVVRLEVPKHLFKRHMTLLGGDCAQGAVLSWTVQSSNEQSKPGKPEDVPMDFWLPLHGTETANVGWIDKRTDGE